MKISFNTRTVTEHEVTMIRNILDELEDEKSGANRVYFTAREPVVEPNPEVTTVRCNVPVDVSFTTSVPEDSIEAAPQSTVIKNIGTVDGVPNVFTIEFEHDQTETHHHQGHYQSRGDIAIPIVPMPEYGPDCVVPSPSTSSVSSFIKDYVNSPPIEAVMMPPVPVSPPPAPQVATEVSTGSTESVDDELDSDGKPWDATIHSETRAKNKDGTWRNRRHTKGVEVKAAIPGLESITPNSVPAPPISRPMVRTFAYVDGAQDIIAAPKDATDEELTAITGKPTTRYAPSQVGQSSPTVVVPPPPPVAPPVVKTAAQGAPIGTFAELMERVTKHFGAQKITSRDLAEVCATFGISSIQECFSQPGIIPLVGNAIDAKAGV